ncbi:MAG: penicillin acylase family protein [Methylothermaceae bacterium]|nr:penicillin acylase family protein [Methylothermaceae bacterium]
MVLFRRLLWLIVALAVIGGGVAFGLLRAGLATLDGELSVATGLEKTVSIERDAHGVPTVRGASRVDLAFATGFLHAQDRFFQMDLLRRRAGGELSELFGSAALEADRAARVHRFRARARQALQLLPRSQREILRAYAEGVNAGLKELTAAPPEYLLLMSRPRPWAVEDGLLTGYAMYLVLQGEALKRETALGVLYDVWGPELYAFLAPLGTSWDAPLDGGRMLFPLMPGSEIVDLGVRQASSLLSASQRHPGPGSNAWAVSGALTESGAAMVANDMHLPLGLPNTWYRLSLVLEEDGAERRVTGASLPGTPLVVVGSNGRVAWGLTNSYIDLMDLVVIDSIPDYPDAYLTPDGPEPFVRHEETIRIRGASDEKIAIRETRWGPVIGRDHRGRELALHWVAHEHVPMDLGLLGLERVDNVREGVAVAQRARIPTQNILLADADGAIAWTLAGPIPRRSPGDTRRPRSWRAGLSWDGWLAPSEIPQIVEPDGGRLWSANARAVSGDAYARLGNGGYYLGARAAQIRDDLRARERFAEADMLSIQLDDRALFLQRWRRLFLETMSRLSEAPPAVMEAVQIGSGRAATDSVGYRLVRAFRNAVYERAFAPFASACVKADPTFDWSAIPQTEGPLWRMVSMRPPHLLNPRFVSWRELLSDAAQAVIAAAEAAPQKYTWGAYNTVQIRHPLGRQSALLGAWLNLPPLPLPGDRHMPRVQTPSFGASMRMAVAPGRESEGLFHMPGGQSGHPLSPYYTDGYIDWAEGREAPFLPGPARYVLRLRPKHSPGAVPSG